LRWGAELPFPDFAPLNPGYALRVSIEVERDGLDLALHGETVQ